MRTRLPLILAIICVLFAHTRLSVAKELGQPRTWSNSTGEYQVEATLLEVRDDRVCLRTTDDREIWVPLDKLSAVDVRYARAHAMRNSVPTPNPFEVADAGPPQVREKNALRAKKLPVATETLYGIRWFAPDDAAQLAQAENKPVMWFRVLGDLDGFM